MKNHVTVLYASQMGAAKEMAGRAADDLVAAGVEAREADFDGYAPENLREESVVLIVASTWGEGEPPDNSEEFYLAFSKAAPMGLGQLKFAILALGDSSYEHFCKHGRELDEEFERHGAERIRARVDCDCDEQQRYPAWIAEMAGLLKEQSVPA